MAPDVVLMDLRMPHRDGLSATTALLARPQAPKVIVLTTLDSDDMVLQALAAGADGFLLKESAPPRMVEAIEAVVRGEPILSPAVTRALIVAATRSVHDDRRAAALASLEPLSDRELQVLKSALDVFLTGANIRCTTCGYCMPCPVGIEIPTQARISLLLGRAPYQPFLEDSFKEKMDRINQCIECGQCKSHCPYQLDTPNLLKRELKRYQEFYAAHVK